MAIAACGGRFLQKLLRLPFLEHVKYQSESVNVYPNNPFDIIDTNIKQAYSHGKIMSTIMVVELPGYSSTGLISDFWNYRGGIRPSYIVEGSWILIN